MENTISLDLGLLCQVVGRRLGVEVIEDPYATTFSTNGNQVTIPTGIAGGEVDAVIMRGGIAHEAAGHILHTDFDAINNWEMAKICLAFGLMNVIEDPRIEVCSQRVYPGTRKMLDDMIHALNARGFFKIPSEPNPEPGRVLCAYLIRVLRVRVKKQQLEIDEVTKIAEDVFGVDVLSRILVVAEAGARSGSTQEVLLAVEAIMAILGEAAKPPEKPEPKPEPKPDEPNPEKGDDKKDGAGQKDEGGQSGGDQDDQGSPGGQSDGDQDGQGSPGGQSDGDQDGQGSPGGQSDGDQDGQGSPGGQSDGDQDGQGSPGDQGSKDGQSDKGGQSGEPTPAQSGAAKRALESTKAQVGPTDLSEVIGEALQGACGRGRSPRKVAFMNMRTPAEFKACALASTLTNRLRASMEQLLQSRVEDEDPDRSEFGRLNTAMLVKGVMGDKYIFQTEGESGEGLNTAIYFLADCSLSTKNGRPGNPAIGVKPVMGNDEVTLAVTFALASAIAAYENQGVKFALSAFNSNVHQIKLFSDPWVKAKKWIGNFKAKGTTMMTEAMRLVLPEIAARKEQRKTLFLLTDGDLGSAEENRRINLLAKREGVDVVLLVIGTGADAVGNHGFSSVSQVKSLDAKAIQLAIATILFKAV